MYSTLLFLCFFLFSFKYNLYFLPFVSIRICVLFFVSVLNGVWCDHFDIVSSRIFNKLFYSKKDECRLNVCTLRIYILSHYDLLLSTSFLFCIGLLKEFELNKCQNDANVRRLVQTQAITVALFS